ncbi:helix-turn-helix domain-containing protein [Fluviicola chungangensis]|uniref:helix-turn-helix domain-containing protein n=1 Tax=Fluviicola chungangensis TaxID=2597671 RepID=UPI0016426D1D|nr:helix-turn-helix transcriptional regulator [Fluviicola chungangensis]
MKNPEYIKAFGENLRKLRTEKGWSQQQLADTANVPKITIQRIELAKSSATIDMAVSIASALEIEVRKLLEF